VSDTYEGTGEFLVGDAPPSGGPRTFGLSSAATDGRGQRRFSFYQQGSGQPPRPGRYAVAAPDYAKPTWATVAAIYIRATDGGVEAYVGRDGEVVISESSGRRVAGTFRFTAIRYCARGGPNQTACEPSVVDPAAPTIEVTGSFTARPGDTSASPAAASAHTPPTPLRRDE
jgi:hypothetical protein